MKKSMLIVAVLSSLMASAQQPKTPQTLRGVLLEQFRQTWVDEDWYVPVIKALDGVTAKQAAWRPADSSHSIGELAYHIWFWNKQNLDRLLGRKPAPFSGNNNESFTGFTEDSWPKLVSQLNDVMKEMETFIKTTDDAKLRASASTIQHDNAHTAYHTGQILYALKLQGVWDANKGVK